MKILVISMAGIGDTLLSTPLIHELRANFPQARIDALALWAGSRDLLEGNPHLNHIYQRNFIKESKLSSLKFLRELGRERYDVSINTHPQSRIHYRIIARIIGAPVRISHVYECSGLLDRLLVNRTLPQDYQRHTVDMNFDILPILGAKPLLPKHELEIYLNDAERNWAETFVRDNQLSQRTVLGVHVGSGGTKNLRFKRWPLGHYLELFKRLRPAFPDLALLLFGGPEEEQDMQKVLAENPAPFALRATSRNLREAAALMKHCDAFLSVDTALMHVAAAMKVPRQIVIEATTLNRTNEPYGNPFTLVRNPGIGGRNLDYYRYDGAGIKGTDEELLRLMASVSIDAVFEAVKKTLELMPS